MIKKDVENYKYTPLSKTNVNDCMAYLEKKQSEAIREKEKSMIRKEYAFGKKE